MLFLVTSDASKVPPLVFNATKENAGMLAAAVVVLVAWLAFRRILEAPERKAKDEAAAPKKADQSQPPDP